MTSKTESRPRSAQAAARRLLVASTLGVLAACDGGSDATSPPATTPPASTSTMTGTVATGAPVAGAQVTLTDVDGKSVTATTDASGNYTASIDGFAAPLMIVAVDPTGIAPTLFSIVASVPTATSTAAVANVTTLTTALTALLTDSGNALDITASGKLAAWVTTSTVGAAEAKLDAALATILAADGLATSSFDPVATAFQADSTGQDAVISAVQLVPAAAGGTAMYSIADPTSALVLNQSTTVSTPLAAPPASAGYLAATMTALASCLGGTTIACAQAIDPAYLENASTSFAAAHPALAAAGVTLGSPRTLEFIAANGSATRALVLIPYTVSGGASGFTTTVVQQTSAGTWTIAGNQQPGNVGIVSYLARRQYDDTADAPYQRTESGLTISIPPGNGNPANLASASVTGPGIAGTAYLLPRNAAGSGIFGFSATPLSSPPVGGATTDSETSLYGWSWLALPGATGAFVPSAGVLGHSTPAPIDVSTVPQFATYTVTFYDDTGAPIGLPFSVINTTPTIAAAAGAGVAWQTLASTVQQSFLDPGGALAGLSSPLALSWSNLVNAQNIAPLVTRAQVQTTTGTGVTPTTSIDGWWLGPASFAANGAYDASVIAGVAQDGVQQRTTACQFNALLPGAQRLIQLTWYDAQGVDYLNIYKYND